MTRTQVSPRTRARRRVARARLRRDRLLGVTAQVVAGTVALGVLAGVLSGGQWPWVVATYLRWPQTILAAVAAGVLVRQRWWRSGAPAVLLAAGLVFSVAAPLRALDTVDVRRADTLRIAVHNTGFARGDVEAVAAAIREADVDVAVLLESDDIAGELDDRLRGFTQLPTPGPRGPESAPPVVLARRPWPTQVVALGDERPAAIVTVRVGERPVDIVAAHPLPPATRAWATSHERAIAALVDEVLPRDRPHVLACDCNTTPWSPSMRRLLDAGLRGPTVAPTFGAPIVGIPLDHVLLSDDVVAVAREHLPFVGSDHRMIVTGIAVADAARDTRP